MTQTSTSWVKRFCYARWKQLFFVFIVLLGVLILEAFVRSPRQRLRPIRTFDTSELYIPKEKTPTAVNSEPIDGKPTTEPIAGKFTTEPIAGKPETSKPKQHYGGYGEGKKECRYGCCFVDPLSRSLPRLDDRYKNPCWYEARYDPVSQSIDGNALIQLTKDKRGSFLDSMGVTWDNRKNQTDQFKCAPYFNIIGNPKSGSTDLYSRLSRHQEVKLPSLKEPQWYTWRRFSPSARNDSSTAECVEIPLSHYISLYDGVSDEIEKAVKTENKMLVTGDGSINLFYWYLDWEFFENQTSTAPQKSIADHIRAVNPNSKIILILRNPTDRLFSAYKYFPHQHGNGNKSIDDFHSDVLHDIKLFNECKSLKGSRACVYDKRLYFQMRLSLTVGLYSVFLQDWLKVFKLDTQMMIINFEVYKHNPIDHMDEVTAFLGISPYSPQARKSVEALKIVNPTQNKLPHLMAETEKLLDEFYEPYNYQLAEMVGDKSYRFWRLDRH